MAAEERSAMTPAGEGGATAASARPRFDGLLRCCLGLLLFAQCSGFSLPLRAPALLSSAPLRAGMDGSAMPRRACAKHQALGGICMRGKDHYRDLSTRPAHRQSSLRMSSEGKDDYIDQRLTTLGSRKQTFLEQAAADDLDQAELELKLASLKAELQAIKTKMSATMRRRRKLLKAKDVPDYFDADGDSRSEYGDSRDSFLESFTGSIDTFATAEEYDMDVAFRRLRVWSRGQAKFMESGSVVHVRTGSRFEDDDDDPETARLIEADEGDVFVFPYGVVVCWGLTQEQTEELQTVMRFCERRGIPFCITYIKLGAMPHVIIW